MSRPYAIGVPETISTATWRNHREAFEEPDPDWDALLLRRNSSQSRYVVVYKGSATILDTSVTVSSEDVQVQTRTSGYSATFEIHDDHCQARIN